VQGRRVALPISLVATKNPQSPDFVGSLSVH
jgi:hypothetical protein